MSCKSGIFAAIAAALICAPSASFAEQYWQVRGGTTSVTLLSGLMNDLGLRVGSLKQTAQGAHDMEDAVGFLVNSRTDMKFRVENGAFSGWESGQIRHSGGFNISSSRQTQAIQDFTVFNLETGSKDNLFVRGSKGASIVLDISKAKVLFNRAERTITIGYCDLLISDELATRLGRRDLSGQLIGSLTIQANAVYLSGQDVDPPALGGDPDSTIDCELFAMSSLTSMGRLGTFPNGTSGLSMSTTSCNRGTSNIPWFAPMNENHPVIAMNLYRERDGKFEQIGMSWLKHGFFATNSGGCGSCQHPGTGQLLGPNCSDTYGTGNNGDRFYLGPRSEVNPLTGRWTCRGSFFAGYQNDCADRRSSGGFNPVEHRLEVRDDDLNQTGSTFKYEAYYILQNDINIYNNVGYRPATATWTGSTWAFSTTGAQTFGPAINSWGDMRGTAEPRTEGDNIVAVKVADLGGGNFFYDYAVYVHSMDRQLREVTIPIPPGVTISNISFRDVDQDAANNWVATVMGDCITWETQTFAENPNANSLKYSTLYNFRFTANAAPAAGTGLLGVFKPGAMDMQTFATRVPGGNTTVPPTNLMITHGTYVSGGLANLHCDDQSYLNIEQRFPFAITNPNVGIDVEATSPTQNPTELRFLVQSRTTAAGLQQRVLLFNWPANQWDEVDVSSTATVDTLREIVISSNPGRYIQAGTRLMKARVGIFDVTLAFLGWNGLFDKVVWKVIP